MAAIGNNNKKRDSMILRSFFAGAFIACMVIFSGGAVFASTAEILQVSQPDFDEKVLAAKDPVLVQFDAKWCPYCRALQPILQRLNEAGTLGITIVKIDADRDPFLVDKFNIKSLPTLIVMSEGKEIARHGGSIKEQALIDWIAEVKAEN